MADVIVIVCTSSFGRCYCQVSDVIATDCNCSNLADDVAKVADVVSTVCDSSLVDVIAKVADGIANHGVWSFADVIASMADGIATESMFEFQFWGLE